MSVLTLSILSLMVSAPCPRQSYALPSVKVGPAVGIGVGVTSELEDIDREVSHTACVSALLNISFVWAEIAFGGRYERRFLVGDGSDADLELNDIPFTVSADINLLALMSLGVEGRFSYQLGDADIHDMMVFAHVAF